MAYPIRCALIVPKDYPPYMSWDQAGEVVHEWAKRVQAWFLRETGLAFDLDFRIHYSNMTIYDIARKADGSLQLDGRDLAPVPEGQGMNQVHIQLDAFGDEMGLWSEVPGKNIYRHWAVIVGAGGWAGGMCHRRDYPDGSIDDWGCAWVGDWRLRYAVTGEADPCCVHWRGEDFCTLEPACSFGHEILHCMDVECHQQYAEMEGPLSEEQRQQLRNNNERFLYIPEKPHPGKGRGHAYGRKKRKT